MKNKAFDTAAQTLRSTVPLMTKNRVPSTPQNYALWYTYVQRTNPNLNNELDQILDTHGLCLPSHNDKLYQNHFVDNREKNLLQVKSALEVLVNQVSFSIKDTLNDTHAFHQVLEDDLSDLSKLDTESATSDNLINLMRSFQQNSSKIKRNTSLFYDQIASANQEISNLKKALEKVTKEARYDGLSGLLNRGAFDKDINKHCSGELPSSFCLVILDIDDFKRLNDEYGHVFGDLVIKSVAKKLQAACDTKFSAYRYGGEEFAIILPNTPLKTAVQFSESLRQSIERISIKDKRSGKSITHISASVGVSQTTNGDNQISITDRADRQLYLAKQSGKNRVMPSNADFT